MKTGRVYAATGIACERKSVMHGDSKPLILASFPELRELGPPEDFPANTELFRQGHHPAVLRLIESGLVKTVREESKGRALVSLREPHWLLGLGPARLKLPYTTSGVTATSCRLRSLPVSDFAHHLEHNPKFSLWVLDAALAQGRRDELLRAELLIYSAPERLVRTLVRLVRVLKALCRHGQVELALPITLGELAQLIGASPDHFRRLLSRLEAEGALLRRRGVLLLPLNRWPELAADPGWSSAK